jgi:hypothetical protein
MAENKHHLLYAEIPAGYVAGVWKFLDTEGELYLGITGDVESTSRSSVVERNHLRLTLKPANPLENV